MTTQIASKVSRMEQKLIYEIRNLTFSYSTTSRIILNSVNLTVKKGDILCVLGPNGAGKTTLLNCMAGLFKPDAGTIMLGGNNLSNMKPKEIASKVGFVPQIHTPSFDYKVLDFVLMGRAPKTGTFGRPSKEDEMMCLQILKTMNLDHLIEESYLNLSGGERQQLLIARAIIQEPEIVLFDEPTAHLDYGNQHRVLKRVKAMAEEGYSVVITTHNPDHALMLNDRVAIVSKDGNIIEGSCEEIITEKNLRQIYGINLTLKYVDELGRKTCFAPNL